jgi:hypothetical protein
MKGAYTMQIREFQYNKHKPTDFQERIINYSSWKDYCKDIKKVDGTALKLLYPSIPRQTRPQVIYEKDGEIMLEYINGLTCKNIVHIAKVIK